MKIGIIGAGSMGTALARHFARLRHDVAIANSRGSASVSALAAEIGAAPASVGDAVALGEVLILAIPTIAVGKLGRAAFANAPRDAVVIDIGNYHPELRDGRIDAIEEGLLDSQWVAQQIGRPVVKAFNNILAESLRDKAKPRGTVGRIALPVAGDSPDARSLVLRLADEVGFDPVDAGGLDNSWRQGTGAPAYCKDLDVVDLQRALAAADRNRVAEYRAQREDQIKRMMQLRAAGAPC